MIYQQNLMPEINLTLFDGGAEGDGAGAVTSGTSGGSQAGFAAAGQSETGEVQKVVYGKQAEKAADAQPSDAGKDTSDTGKNAEDKKRAYREMVDGEFKDQYSEDMQHIINRRFRETQNLQEQLKTHQPIIDTLMARYGIKNGDMAALQKAVENDDVYWAQAAEDAGMSVEQFKTVQKLQRENAELLRAEESRRGREFAQRQLAQWIKQSEDLKNEYPNFDLRAEVDSNPQFLSLLRSGATVKLAYEAVHMDEIKAGVARQQDRATEKRVVDGIRARGTRPQENGTSSKSAFTVKDNVSQLTNKDMEEIRRRVMRGERISFG